MVARSCALLIFIALENIEARKDFQVLKKRFSYCSLSYVWGSLLWVWFELWHRLGQGAQWCLWGAELSLPGNEIFALEDLQQLLQLREGSSQSTRSTTDQHGASGDLGFHLGASGFWELFCLYMPWEFPLAAGLGLGICPGFCPRCWWHHLFSPCCRFCCQLCSFELVLSVLYFTPDLVFLWISWCGEEVLLTSQWIPFCMVCPALQHCLFLPFVLDASAKNSVPKQLWRLISLHCAILQHPLFFRGCGINISAYLLGLLFFFLICFLLNKGCYHPIMVDQSL